MSDETPAPRPDDGEVTLLLRRWSEGDRGAVDDLLPLVYQDLRELARAYLRRERSGHTLPPTALVHEAYLRLLGTDPAAAGADTRRHFFAVAAQAMRRILVEHARHHAAARRPPVAGRSSFTEEGLLDRRPDEPVEEILAVHEGLERLRADHPRQARVVELRYFGGLGEEEVAEVLDVSRATVARDWRVARLLLARLLRGEPGNGSGG